MANAFSGSRQQLYSPYSQIGTDPFGYSPGGTFMGGYGMPSYGGYGGYGGGFGMPSYGGMYGGQDLFGSISPFVSGFGSGIGGYGGGAVGSAMNRVQSMLSGGYPTTFGGGSQGYQFPVPPQPSVNDLFGQYMMNTYYGGGAFNPYTLPQSQPRMRIPRPPVSQPVEAPPTYDDQGRPYLRPRPPVAQPDIPMFNPPQPSRPPVAQPDIARQTNPAMITPEAIAIQPPALQNFNPFTMPTPLPQPLLQTLPAPVATITPSAQTPAMRLPELPQFNPNLIPTPAAIQQQLNAAPAPAPQPAPAPAPAPALDIASTADRMFNDFVRSNPNADPAMLRNLANERAAAMAARR